MGNKKSRTVDKRGSIAQASAHSKGAIEHGQNNIKMVQNVLLIWLDNTIDDSSLRCRNTITQFRHAINTINTYTNAEECIEFIESLDNEKVCMIISGFLGRNIVPRVHNMSQVDSIIIFPGNKRRHRSWTKEWSKIIGVFTEIALVYEELKKVGQQCEQNAISINFMATSGDVSKKNLDQLELSFMYTQILKEILLSIEFEQKHFTEYIKYCRDTLAENEIELKNVDKLQKEYGNKTPIWWYTYECFLYPMLNRALRLMDVDIIIQMGFFIRDLHRQIEQLHNEQFCDQNSGKRFTVHHGQGMIKFEFKQMTKAKGGFISFNNYLSTSKDRKVSLNFANRAATNPDLIGILFVMTIDPAKSTTPFASITEVSYFHSDDKVLFSIQTVFRICDIKPMDESNRLFQVDLTLTSDNDTDLRVLTDRIREETFADQEGWYRLGLVLLKIGQSDKAQHVNEILLEQKTDETEKAAIYEQLGCAEADQGAYEEAVTFHQKALQIYKNSRSPNLPDLAKCYNNIGTTYGKMKGYAEALPYLEKALELRQESLPPNHLDLAMSYNNIGLAYETMGEYLKAFSFHEKALEIRQESLPSNHPDLAASYNNIGNVYFNIGYYSKALLSHKEALKIQQELHPPNHSDLAIHYNNIGTTYGKMKEYAEALPYLAKALEVRQESLPANHPDLAMSYNNIGVVYHNIGEYLRALSSYGKALEIQQESLPPNHPDVATSYNNIGLIYENLDDYTQARSFYERAVDIGKESLPWNHSYLRKWRRSLKRIKKKL